MSDPLQPQRAVQAMAEIEPDDLAHCHHLDRGETSC